MTPISRADLRPRRVFVAFAVLLASIVTVPLLSDSSPVSAAVSMPIDVSSQYTCAVVEDGTVECWGLDESGKLGTAPSTGATRSTPTTVPGVSGARGLALGEEHACALLVDGTVTCWGSNDYAQLGNGTVGGDEVPPTPVAGLTDVDEIVSGGYHTCALGIDGSVRCWGPNWDGVVGADPAIDEYVTSPRLVPGLDDIVDIDASLDNTCVIDADGVVACWGSGDEGLLGPGNSASFVPVSIPFSGPAGEVAPSDRFICAVLVGGTVECLGHNSSGQLGDGTTDQSDTPVTVQGVTTARELAVGGNSACARLADGGVLCWGDAQLGQLGNGEDRFANRAQTTPVPVIDVSDAARIVGYDDHYCVATWTGDARCWGEARNGQLGIDAPDFVTTPHLATTMNAADIAVGDGFTCLRGVGGSAACFGSNGSGQFGNGTTAGSDTPAAVDGLTEALQIDAGGDHACAVVAGGTARCWGRSTSGQLGHDGWTSALTPVTVLDATGSASLDGVTVISTGEQHTCARTTDQSAWCWGRGNDGQIGDGGTTTFNRLPVEVSGIDDAGTVAAGEEHSCATVTGGAVKCWGDNGRRQLGNGSTTDSPLPVPVDSVTAVEQLSAGAIHTCGRTAGASAGEVWCWGHDSYGQLGDGPGASIVPVKMSGISTATEVAAGDGVTCVLLADETVACSGNNEHGAIGDGTTTDRDTATQVIAEGGLPLTGIRSIAADQHVCASRSIAAGGGVFCWGHNDEGQVGFFPWRSTPVFVPLTQTIWGTTTTTTSTTIPETTTTAPDPTPEVALFSPVAPARLVESRVGAELTTVDGLQQGVGRLGAGAELTVDVAGRADVPEGASAAVVNVTAIRPSGIGYVTMYPCLPDRPLTSSLNYTEGVSLGNEVVVELDDRGDACLYTSAATDVVVDIVAYLPATSPYTPVGPARLADTRTGSDAETVDGDFLGAGTLAAAGTYTVQVSGRADIPASATAAVVNVTAIRAAGVGYFTIHPCLPTPPNAASLNYTSTANRGNEIIAPLSADGTVCVFTSAATDLAMDVVGYIDSDAYTPVDPARLLETRSGDGLTTADGAFEGVGSLSAGTTLRLDVAGRLGIPADAETVTVNVTAIQAGGVGYLTVHPCLPEPPNAASLNYAPGVNGGNEIIAQLDADGDLCIFTSSDVHATVDIAGHTT